MRYLVGLFLAFSAWAGCGQAPADPPCEPLGCDGLCGSAPDGCGGRLECGGCILPAVCGTRGDENLCAIPEAERECTGSGWCFESPGPQPMSPSAMHARAPDDVWAVGDGGFIRHFDGTRWREVVSGISEDLNDVWSAGVDEAWAVGDQGTFLRWDGVAWMPVVAGQGTARLGGLSGTALDDVWVVGEGISLHWDGAGWQPIPAPFLEHVYAAGPSDVFATTRDDIYQLAGSSWEQAIELGDVTITGIAGRSPSQAWAVGVQHRLFDSAELNMRWDGSEWTLVGTAAEYRVADVYASPDQIVAVRPSSLTVLSGERDLPAPPLPIGRVAAVSATEQFLLSPGAAAFHLDGETWAPATFGPSSSLRGVGRAGSSVWFAGGAVLLEWNGSGLRAHRPDRVSATAGAGFVAVAGVSETDVWAVDLDPGFWSEALYHWDGISWRTEDTPDILQQLHALAVVGGTLYLAGEGLYRHDGSAWVAEPEVPAGLWRAIAEGAQGSLWLAGSGGSSEGALLVHRGPGGWTEIEVPDLDDACALYVAGDADVWVAGHRDDGELKAVVAHWDGEAFTSHLLPDVAGGFLSVRDSIPCGIVAPAADDVWVTAVPGGTGEGLLYHFDGSSWTPDALLRTGAVRALLLADDGLWAAGDHGAVLRKE